MVLYSRTCEITNTTSVVQRISSVSRGDPLGGSPYSPAIVPRLSFDVSRSKRRTATCHRRRTLALRLLLRDGRRTLALRLLLRDCRIRLAVRLLLRDGRIRLAVRLLLRDGRIEEGTCLLLREIPEFYFLWEVRASCFEDSGNSLLVKRP